MYKFLKKKSIFIYSILKYAKLNCTVWFGSRVILIKYDPTSNFRLDPVVVFITIAIILIFFWSTPI